MSIVKHIGMDRLKDITESYKSLKFYGGIVDLVLLYASLEDVSALMTEKTVCFCLKDINRLGLSCASLFQTVGLLPRHF